MSLLRPFRRLVAVAILLIILIYWSSVRMTDGPAVADARAHYPRITKYIEGGTGSGGAWHLPRSWTQDLDTPLDNIVAAAQLALNQSSTQPLGRLPHSNIPRIIHQTWKDTQFETWRPTYLASTEKWLGVVEEEDIPYLFWDDAGIAQFMQAFEPDLEAEFYGLPSPVERSDVFRVLVCKWFGGVYVDLDTEPLQSPTDWITTGDLSPWTDFKTNRLYHSTQAVNAIVGIEADTDPDTDAYWRMGYFFPIQLTQWAFAFAPHHPILQLFIERLRQTIQLIMYEQQLLTDPEQDHGLDWIDPVNLTGPIAFTDSVRTYLDQTANLRWDALTGLHDKGTTKFVEDVLVLPITGFNPNRGRFQNMGSKPATDPSARLHHHAEGSWRHWSLRVEMGKLCRTAFGLCRDWSKVPHKDSWIF